MPRFAFCCEMISLEMVQSVSDVICNQTAEKKILNNSKWFKSMQWIPQWSEKGGLGIFGVKNRFGAILEPQICFQNVLLDQFVEFRHRIINADIEQFSLLNVCQLRQKLQFLSWSITYPGSHFFKFFKFFRFERESESEKT